MISKIFDLHLHRLASLSNIINFSNVNLYNFQTFELISLHLGGFLFGTLNTIFSEHFTDFNQIVTKPPKLWSLGIVEHRILNLFGGRGMWDIKMTST